MDLQSPIDNDNVWFDDDIKAIDRGKEIANGKTAMTHARYTRELKEKAESSMKKAVIKKGLN